MKHFKNWWNSDWTPVDWALWLSFCFSLGMLVGTLWPLEARSHDAPAGWSYDPSCCNTNDCRQVSSLNDPAPNSKIFIREVTGGYSVEKPNNTSEFVEWNSKKIRISKDPHYHWCSYMMGSDETGTICLYVPDRGY